MLNRISDFYRAAYPEPTDTLITQRKEAITAFLGQFSRREIMYACAEIAAFGLSPAPAGLKAEAAAAIVKAIQGPQPSLSGDISANAVDLRIFAGIALGEHLQTHNDLATAALVVSALATRPIPQERFLADFVVAFLGVAQKSLEDAGHARRERPDLEVTAVQGTDPASIAKSVKNALDQFKHAVDRNLRADHEELEILWWIFGGRSTTLGKSFQNLDISQRILASGSELADLVLLPPANASVQFLQAILREERSLTVRQLIEPAPLKLLQSVVARGAVIGPIIASHPALLPLSWVISRCVDSGESKGWETEFERKAHISPDEERAALGWVGQVFNECVAARLLAEMEDQLKA